MVKPEFLVGKNNDNSVHAKPVDLVDMICHALHVKSGDLTSNTNIASVHVKPVDSVGKNNGSALHAKKCNLARKNNCDTNHIKPVHLSSQSKGCSIYVKPGALNCKGNGGSVNVKPVDYGVKRGALATKNNGDSLHAKSEHLSSKTQGNSAHVKPGNKNNGDSVDVKPVELGVKRVSYVYKNTGNSVSPKPLDMSRKTKRTSVYSKLGNLSANTKGNYVTVKTEGHSANVKAAKVDCKTKIKDGIPNTYDLDEKSMCGKSVDLDGDTDVNNIDDLIEEVDWIFQPKSLKKKTPFEAQETKVHNRFSLFEDDEEDNVVKSILEINEDVKCHGSKNKYKSEEIPVEGKASKENSTKRKRTN